MDKQKKIFITGAHLTPAVALIEELLNNDWKIWYIGRKYSQEDDKSISAEYKRILKYNSRVTLLTITTGKLQRYLDLTFFISLIKIPYGFIQSVIWLLTLKPNIVVSFGGYVGLPVCLGAYILKIPILIHEQTRSPGLANKIIARLAGTVCVAYKESSKFFSENKVQITGLPIRKVIFTQYKKLDINLDKPLLYISGGSQGSHAINDLFKPILKKILADFCVIHQCGSTIKYHDLDKFKNFKVTLPPPLSKRYFPIDYIDEDYIGWVYKNTHFAISRSGANTVGELAVLGIPAIFIPISWSSSNEQYQNAKFFKDNNSGEILIQEKTSSQVLLNTIEKFSKNISQYKSSALQLKKSVINNGAVRLASLIEKVHN